MQLVRVYSALDELMANSVRDLLLQNGVGAMSRQLMNMGLEGISAGQFGLWGEVLVYDKDVEKALELIGGFLGDLGMLEEAEDLPEESEEFPTR